MSEDNGMKIALDGVPHKLGTPHPIDLILLERKFGVGPKQMQDDPRTEHTMFLTWCAMRRRGVIEASVQYNDDFLARLGFAEDDENEVAGDPTSPATETTTEAPSAL